MGETALISYKCPNCGGGLLFDPEIQKLKCEYCQSEFTEEELQEQKEGHGPVVCSCPSCGAEIITEETTAASFCYYCHNPVVFTGKLSGEYRPDYVVPFSVDREKAGEIFRSWIRKKKFVPKSFFSEEQIEKFTGVYFPYMLYSCQVEGKVKGEAEVLRTWTAGNIRYTEHKKFQVEREGVLDVRNVTRSALSKANRELIEGVLPFEMENMKPFSAAYLSGFQAEKRDLGGEDFAPEVEAEVRSYTIENLRNSMDGYQAVCLRDQDTQIRNARWAYGLLPVWILTYRERGKDQVYYFAVNGQTGKSCGKLPVSRKKLAGLFLSVFLPVFAFFLIGGWFL